MRTAILVVLGLALAGGAGAMADKEPFFELGKVETGLPGNVEIPSLGADRDGRIYCVFSQNIQAIWLMATPDTGKTWEKPVRVMDCPGPGYITDANILVAPGRLTVYTTFVPKNTEKTFARSQTMASSSTDGGATWSPAESLPMPHRYICGKIHVPVRLDDQTVAMGYSWDVPAEEGKPAGTEGGMFLKSGVLLSRDGGRSWTPGGDVAVDIRPIGADEPAIVRLANGDLFMVLRTSGRRPYETLSRDGGQTWETPKPSAFYGHNSPTALLRLRDGAILRAWDNSPAHRYPLVVSLSTDECRTWSPPRTITEPEAGPDGKLAYRTACYPSLAEGPDGTLLAAWWQRTDAGVNSLGCARFNRAWVEAARNLPQPRKIVAFGDSVTLGARAGVAEPQTFRCLLQAALKKGGLSVEVVNAGIGGHNTRHALERLEGDVLLEKPEVVTVMFGVNDAAMVDGGPVARTEPRVPLEEYRRNLTTIVRRIQESGARVVLCTPTPMSRAYAYSNLGAYAQNEDMNFMVRRYAEAAREVARDTGATLVDTFRLFIDRPDGLKLIEDGCHPYVEGHRLIADALLEPVKAALGTAAR